MRLIKPFSCMLLSAMLSAWQYSWDAVLYGRRLCEKTG